MQEQWIEEKIYVSGDDFFLDVIQGINSAKTSIWFESYIFEPGQLASRVTAALRAAAQRGVRVHVLVDGIGSPLFIPEFQDALRHPQIRFRVYHPAPWTRPFRPLEILQSLRGLNRRNHRKVCLIDEAVAWMGGMNVSDWHLKSIHPHHRWRDTSIRLRGEPLHWLAKEMRSTFSGKRPHHKYISPNTIMRLNSTWRQRRALFKNLLRRIQLATDRIFITTAYFVPSGPLLRELRKTAKREVEVKILVPQITDMPWLRWLSQVFYEQLLREKIRIFEYQRRILHAKTLVIDQSALIGSSNINSRSLSLDLEIDAVLSHPESIATLERQFHKDLGDSVEITLDRLNQRPHFYKWTGRLLVLFRSWL